MKDPTVGHPRTAETLKHLAALAPPADEAPDGIQDRKQNAARLLEKAVAIQSESLGPDHAETVDTLKNLLEAWKAAGNQEEAESVHRRLAERVDKSTAASR